MPRAPRKGAHAAARVEGPRGVCAVCGSLLRVDNVSGVCHRTRACANEQARRWRIANPVARKRSEWRNNLTRHYGIGPEQYTEILAAQGGRCAVCRCVKPGGAGRFHVDHDHGSGVIRGLLCHGCNTGTKITDDVELLRAKIAYLTRPLLRVAS